MTVTFKTDEYESIAATLELLSQLWLFEVDESMIERLKQLGPEFEALGGAIPVESDNLLEKLAVDYCQLLIGPKNHVSPVQSIWKEDTFAGDTSASMRKFIEILEDYESPSSFVDHVGVQLDFLAALFRVKEKPDSFDEILTDFQALHLKWTAKFFDAVEQKAKTDFYIGLAKVSRVVCESLNDD